MPKNNTALNDPLIGAPKIWVAEFVIPVQFTNYFSEALEEVSIGVKSYEQVEDNPDWVLRIYFQEQPEQQNIQNRVNALFEAINLPTQTIKVFEIENKNWVLELAKEFKAITTSQFHIYSQFSEPSKNHINIQINPGMAFGTGQHETTFLCLEAISWLAKEGKNYSNILDLGCGSGILAIAASKIWEEADITASDNDPIATDVCIENAQVNDCDMKALVSEGYASIPANKFDLILANILMNPLLQLAEDMQKYSSSTLVLSGFKTDQVQSIEEKYKSLGFTPAKTFSRNDWISLVLSR
jgi:ribosomal protein L11 methyltransferase